MVLYLLQVCAPLGTGLHHTHSLPFWKPRGTWSWQLGQAYSHCLELQAGTGSADHDTSGSSERHTTPVGAEDSLGHSLHRRPTLFTLSDLHLLSLPCPSLTHLPLARQIDLHTTSLGV